ncbi:hypothetical protein AAMO2058_000835100 [Amorphochlora amoebiformis]
MAATGWLGVLIYAVVWSASGATQERMTLEAVSELDQRISSADVYAVPEAEDPLVMGNDRDATPDRSLYSVNLDGSDKLDEALDFKLSTVMHKYDALEEKETLPARTEDYLKLMRFAHSLHQAQKSARQHNQIHKDAQRVNKTTDVPSPTHSHPAAALGIHHQRHRHQTRAKKNATLNLKGDPNELLDELDTEVTLGG